MSNGGKTVKRTNHDPSDANWGKWEKRIRDAVIFLIGIGGVLNELFILEEPRISVLVFLGSLIGVPFVLGADERRTKAQDRDEDQ